MKPGSDNAVYDSKGKCIAVLLASTVPTHFELERRKKLYEAGSGGKVTLRARGE
jgi:hypothetical protein